MNSNYFILWRGQFLLPQFNLFVQCNLVQNSIVFWGDLWELGNEVSGCLPILPGESFQTTALRKATQVEPAPRSQSEDSGKPVARAFSAFSWQGAGCLGRALTSAGDPPESPAKVWQEHVSEGITEVWERTTRKNQPALGLPGDRDGLATSWGWHRTKNGRLTSVSQQLLGKTCQGKKRSQNLILNHIWQHILNSK